MATLNQIGERIAFALNEPLNYVLKENIKFSVKYYRSLFIRRDVAANGLSDEFLQKFHVPLLKVDKADDCAFNLGCTVLRTKNKVPKPVRLKSDVLFKFAGTPSGKGFNYTEFEELRSRLHNKYTANEIVYSYINGYIYIYNASKLKYVALQYIVDNPEEINFCATSDTCYDDDKEFPIASDFLADIVTNILSKEFRIMNPTDEQVNIDTKDVIN